MGKKKSNPFSFNFLMPHPITINCIKKRNAITAITNSQRTKIKDIPASNQNGDKKGEDNGKAWHCDYDIGPARRTIDIYSWSISNRDRSEKHYWVQVKFQLGKICVGVWIFLVLKESTVLPIAVTISYLPVYGVIIMTVLPHRNLSGNLLTTKRQRIMPDPWAYYTRID